MAKSSRSSTRKANNQRLKRNVFGPVEAARNERLSAKLIELASQPKPERPEASEMKVVDEEEEEEANVENEASAAAKEGDDTMDVDTIKAALSKRASNKNRIMKRKKSNKVVFPMFKDKKPTKRKH